MRVLTASLRLGSFDLTRFSNPYSVQRLFNSVVSCSMTVSKTWFLDIGFFLEFSCYRFHQELPGGFVCVLSTFRSQRLMGIRQGLSITQNPMRTKHLCNLLIVLYGIIYVTKTHSRLPLLTHPHPLRNQLIQVIPREVEPPNRRRIGVYWITTQRARLNLIDITDPHHGRPCAKKDDGEGFQTPSCRRHHLPKPHQHLLTIPL